MKRDPTIRVSPPSERHLVGVTKMVEFFRPKKDHLVSELMVPGTENLLAWIRWQKLYIENNPEVHAFITPR